MPLNFFTCSYSEFRPAMGVPVRSSIGHPRYKLPYPLEHALKEVMPTRPMLSLDIDTYRERYFQILDGHDVEGVVAAGMKIVEGAGDSRLVLLCFEKLYEAGKWCHRSMFGDWWLERTGEEVRELGARADDRPTLL